MNEDRITDKLMRPKMKAGGERPLDRATPVATALPRPPQWLAG